MPGPLRRGVFGVVVLLVAFGCSTASHARSRAPLVVLEVGEPLSILGKTYPGGRLALRPMGGESPGVTLHTVSLDGIVLGVLPARLRPRARERTEATGFFGRDGKGRLHLIGYVSADRGTYRF